MAPQLKKAPQKAEGSRSIVERELQRTQPEIAKPVAGAAAAARRADHAASRQAAEVMADHLERRLRDDFEGDLAHNYAENVVLLTRDGIYHGHDGLRQCHAMLECMLPGARFEYELVRISGEVAMLGWAATADGGVETRHGVDSFVIRDGVIAAQTIHFDVKRPGDE